MGVEDSIIIAEFTRRLNTHVARTGAAPTMEDVSAIKIRMFDDAGIVSAPLRKQIAAEFKVALKDLVQAERQVRQEICRDWNSAFDALDKCIAYVAFLNSRFIQVAGRNLTKLESKDPRCRKGCVSDTVVTGATLKCFLLISLLARSCCISSEISRLLRYGLSSGAQGRLRSLHELSVVTLLLCNDDTYEIAERYQDHAVYEMLKELRAHRRALGGSVWKRDSARDGALAQEIAEAEKAAQDARSRWGSDMAEQYGWARPAVGGRQSRGRQITFSDLESAAGADFLRGEYLNQNHHIHAGPFAAINHILDGRSLVSGRRDDDVTRGTGLRTVFLLTCSLQVICMAICAETEEYDEMLYSCELTPVANMARRRFNECPVVRRVV